MTVSYQLRDSKLASSQSFQTILVVGAIASGVFTLTSAYGLPAIAVDANGDSSQAAVNELLEFDSAGVALSAVSTSEIDYATACGSTALGTDAIAVIVKCGDVKKVLGAEIIHYGASSAALVQYVAGTTTVPPNTLTETLYKTPAGNIFLRAVVTGADAADGQIVMRIHVQVK